MRKVFFVLLFVVKHLDDRDNIEVIQIKQKILRKNFITAAVQLAAK